MLEKDSLLKKVQTYDFVLVDLNLYLDSHPNCPYALEHYNRTLRLRDEAAKEYTEKFGPLTIRDVKDTTHWTWTDGPWPWESSYQFPNQEGNRYVEL